MLASSAPSASAALILRLTSRVVSFSILCSRTNSRSHSTATPRRMYSGSSASASSMASRCSVLTRVLFEVRSIAAVSWRVSEVPPPASAVGATVEAPQPMGKFARLGVFAEPGAGGAASDSVQQRSQLSREG